MVGYGACPVKLAHRMAFGTIGRIISFYMIGTRGSIIIITVAVETSDSEWLKIQQRSRFMTHRAISRIMGAQEREPRPLMNDRDVVYDPGVSGVTSLAVGAYRLVMYIGMASRAFDGGLRKNQCRVTLPAVNAPVLPGKRKRGFIMIKGVNLFIEMPAF